MIKLNMGFYILSALGCKRALNSSLLIAARMMPTGYIAFFNMPYPLDYIYGRGACGVCPKALVSLNLGFKGHKNHFDKYDCSTLRPPQKVVKFYLIQD